MITNVSSRLLKSGARFGNFLRDKGIPVHNIARSPFKFGVACFLSLIVIIILIRDLNASSIVHEAPSDAAAVKKQSLQRQQSKQQQGPQDATLDDENNNVPATKQPKRVKPPPATTLGANQSALVYYHNPYGGQLDYSAPHCLARLKQATYHWPHCIHKPTSAGPALHWANENKCNFRQSLHGELEFNEEALRLLMESVVGFFGDSTMIDAAGLWMKNLEFLRKSIRKVDKMGKNAAAVSYRHHSSDGSLYMFEKGFRRDDLMGSLLLQLHPETAQTPKFRTMFQAFALAEAANFTVSRKIMSTVKAEGASLDSFISSNFATRHAIVASFGVALAVEIVLSDREFDYIGEDAAYHLSKLMMPHLETFLINSILEGGFHGKKPANAAAARPADLVILIQQSLDCGALHAMVEEHVAPGGQDAPEGSLSPVVEKLSSACNNVNEVLKNMNSMLDAQLGPFISRTKLEKTDEEVQREIDPTRFNPDSKFSTLTAEQLGAIRDRLFVVSPLKCGDGHLLIDPVSRHCTSGGIKLAPKFENLRFDLIMNILRSWDDCVLTKTPPTEAPFQE